MEGASKDKVACLNSLIFRRCDVFLRNSSLAGMVSLVGKVKGNLNSSLRKRSPISYMVSVVWVLRGALALGAVGSGEHVKSGKDSLVKDKSESPREVSIADDGSIQLVRRRLVPRIFPIRGKSSLKPKEDSKPNKITQSSFQPRYA